MKYTFFGFQLGIETTLDAPLRTELAKLIVDAPQRQTILDKHAFWTRVSALLRRHKHEFIFGDWDLVRGQAAPAAFEEWTQKLERSNQQPDSFQLLPGEARTAPRTEHHILVTAVFLVEQHSNSDRTLAEVSDIEELDYFTRDTFFLFLGAVTELNFTSVRSDAIYMVPGPNTEGFSQETLMSLEFDYLKLLRY